MCKTLEIRGKVVTTLLVKITSIVLGLDQAVAHAHKYAYELRLSLLLVVHNRWTVYVIVTVIVTVIANMIAVVSQKTVVYQSPWIEILVRQ